MFSQLRNAVEGLASPPPRNRTPIEERSQLGARSKSPESPSSIAEAALFNLKKSLASQRAVSPHSSSPTSKGHPPQELRPHKPNLEERLRAKFAIGEASNSTTPGQSGANTLAGAPVAVSSNHPLSPTSVPLPDSPDLSSLVPLNENESSPELVLPLPIHSPQPRSPRAHGVPLVAEMGVPEKVQDSTIDFKEFRPNGVVVTSIPEVISSSSEAPADAIWARLKLLEEKFADVSKTCQRLQSEKAEVDSLLKQHASVTSSEDIEGLKTYFESSALQIETAQDDIQRLNGKLTRQEERIGELRDTHRLESTSQSSQIESLRRQLEETETLLKATESNHSQSEDSTSEKTAEIGRLQAEILRLTTTCKEEEEKRTKAVSLLKTVRQKLVKAEKEKDETAKEMLALRERDRSERDKERADKAKLLHDLNVITSEREKAMASLKVQHDADMANTKSRFEGELTAIRGQCELEAMANKVTHTSEINALNGRIASLESSMSVLASERNGFFEQSQLRHAELESAHSRLDALQGELAESQLLLRESQERVALLQEELFDARREQDSRGQESLPPSKDPENTTAALKTLHKNRIDELQKMLSAMEKERVDMETSWSLKLKAKTSEIEELKATLDSSAKSKHQKEDVVEALRNDIRQLQNEIQIERNRAAQLQQSADSIRDIEDAAAHRAQALSERVSALEKDVQESKTHEAQLRAHNKTLRDELRKVQTSAALLEKQRNPGVGYWTSRSDGSPKESSSARPASMDDSRSSSPSQNDEEVNLEYLRNVILQFLEHKEMRPNLVRVLSIILHFTPQETRRLMAKV